MKADEKVGQNIIVRGKLNMLLDAINIVITVILVITIIRNAFILHIDEIICFQIITLVKKCF